MVVEERKTSAEYDSPDMRKHPIFVVLTFNLQGQKNNDINCKLISISVGNVFDHKGKVD